MSSEGLLLQSLIKTHWNEHAKPAIDVVIQKVLSYKLHFLQTILTRKKKLPVASFLPPSPPFCSLNSLVWGQSFIKVELVYVFWPLGSV